jgi:hypothetical protein
VVGSRALPAAAYPVVGSAGPSVVAHGPAVSRPVADSPEPGVSRPGQAPVRVRSRAAHARSVAQVGSVEERGPAVPAWAVPAEAVPGS